MQILRKIGSVLGRIWYPVRSNFMFLLTMYVLGIIVAYVTLPNYKKAEIYENTYWELFFDLYFICLLLWCIPRIARRWVRAAMYVVGYGLAIVDCFCFVRFESTISPTMLLLVDETDGREAGEFLSTYAGPDVIFTNLGWVLLLLLVHILLTLAWVYRGRIRRYIPVCAEKLKSVRDAVRLFYAANRIPADIVLSIAVVVILACGWDASVVNKKCQQRMFSCQTIGDVEKVLNEHPHAQMYEPPYRLAFAMFSNHLTSLQLDRLKATVDKVQIDSCSYTSPNIVLIIGESYNKHHSQMYGYDKKTTPRQMRLARSGRLTKFTDVTTPWNLTSFVFKHLMTTYCVGDKGDWCDYPLFCEIFRKAGYHVTFLTNQFLPKAKDAVYDLSGGFFLNDEVLSKAQFDVRNEELHLWDEDLIKDYDRLKPHPLKEGAKGGDLTIFHLMGQHVNYHIRCPKSKMHFHPEDYAHLTQNTDKDKRNIAYYDCAVWYNDSVVDRIVDKFRKEEAIIIYVPDHGEEVYGPGSLHHCGRRHTTHITTDIASQEYEIPMWIYCTDKYARKHPEVKQAVVQARKKPFMTDALSHMLMGLAGIHCKYYQSKYDLLSPEYDVTRHRMMQHVVDYDNLEKSKEYK